MEFYLPVLGLLGVWRITHLLNAEDGPWNLFAHLRGWLGSGMVGKMFDCFYCLSLWVSIPFSFYIGGNWKEKILLWLALSGGAILLERATMGGKEREPGFHPTDGGGES